MECAGCGQVWKTMSEENSYEMYACMMYACMKISTLINGIYKKVWFYLLVYIFPQKSSYISLPVFHTSHLASFSHTPHFPHSTPSTPQPAPYSIQPSHLFQAREKCEDHSPLILVFSVRLSGTRQFCSNCLDLRPNGVFPGPFHTWPR